MAALPIVEAKNMEGFQKGGIQLLATPDRLIEGPFEAYS